MVAHFSSQVARWSALVFGLWMLACGGLSYNFAIYSAKLKDSLGYSQSYIDLLGTAKDIGDNVGLLAGFLSAIVPPWALLLIGAIQNAVGYSSIYLIASKKIDQPPFWQVFFSMWLGVNGSTYFNTAALVTCVRSFPHSRGVVVGMLKAMVGLSGAIFAQVYTALVAPDQIGFLLVVAVGPPLIAIISMPFLRAIEAVPGSRTPEYVAEESKNLRFLFILFLTLAGYLMADMIVSYFVPLTKSQSQLITAGMFLIISLTLSVPIKMLISSWNQAEEDSSQLLTNRLLPHQQKHTGIHIDTSGPSRVARYEAGALGSVSVRDLRALVPRDAETLASAADLLPLKTYVRPRRGEDFSLAEGLVKADFWLLFVSVLCAAGSGLTAMNNLAQIGEAQGSGDVKIAVSLVSIWNYMGRVIGGFYSEHLVRRHGLPRPAILVGCHAAMALGHFMFAFAVPGSVYLGSLVVGTGFGTTMAMVPTVASELFGLRNFGMFYNVFTSALPVGSYLFSGLLAGYVYDREAQKEAGQGLGPAGASLAVGPGGGKVACHGAHCFKLTFLVMAAICVVATLADVLLVVRTFPVYRRLYPREEDMQEEEEEGNT